MEKLYKDRNWLNMQYIILKQSTPEIGKICDVSHVTIYNWLKKYNIYIRTLSEAMKISHNKPEYKKKMREANLGEKNPMFGRTGEECYLFGKFGKEHPAWKGNTNKRKNGQN